MLWISDQALAIYGSVVGTMALGINLFTYIHAKQKDRVRLLIECHEDEDAAKSVQYFGNCNNKPGLDAPNLLPIYVITIRNIGNIEAHLQEVGVTEVHGAEHCVLVSSSSHYFLTSIASADPISIQPKAMLKFKIYLKRGEPIYTPVNCFVIDQQHKKWKRRVKLLQLDRHLKSS